MDNECSIDVFYNFILTIMRFILLLNITLIFFFSVFLFVLSLFDCLHFVFIWNKK